MLGYEIHMDYYYSLLRGSRAESFGIITVFRTNVIKNTISMNKVINNVKFIETSGAMFVFVIQGNILNEKQTQQ